MLTSNESSLSSICQVNRDLLRWAEPPRGLVEYVESVNAIQRAIQPSPALLGYIEDASAIHRALDSLNLSGTAGPAARVEVGVESVRSPDEAERAVRGVVSAARNEAAARWPVDY